MRRRAEYELNNCKKEQPKQNRKSAAARAIGRIQQRWQKDGSVKEPRVRRNQNRDEHQEWRVGMPVPFCTVATEVPNGPETSGDCWKELKPEGIGLQGNA